MTLPFLLLLAVAPVRVTLMDEAVGVPHSEWRTLPIGLQQQPGTLECAYRVIHGKPDVRLALLPKEDADALRTGLPHAELAATPSGPRGELKVPIRTLGEYELVVDNREGETDVELHLKVSLVFGDSSSLDVRYASPQRRAVVAVASLSFFAAVAAYAGVKLRKALDTRP